MKFSKPLRQFARTLMELIVAVAALGATISFVFFHNELDLIVGLLFLLLIRVWRLDNTVER